MLLTQKSPYDALPEPFLLLFCLLREEVISIFIRQGGLRRDVAFDGSWPKARLQEDDAGLWQCASCILPQF
jgi:hypothetical protein